MAHAVRTVEVFPREVLQESTAGADSGVAAEAAIEGKWSPRQTLIFIVASSLALWTLIGLGVWSLF